MTPKQWAAIQAQTGAPEPKETKAPKTTTPKETATPAATTSPPQEPASATAVNVVDKSVDTSTPSNQAAPERVEVSSETPDYAALGRIARSVAKAADKAMPWTGGTAYLTPEAKYKQTQANLIAQSAPSQREYDGIGVPAIDLTARGATQSPLLNSALADKAYALAGKKDELERLRGLRKQEGFTEAMGKAQGEAAFAGSRLKLQEEAQRQATQNQEALSRINAKRHEIDSKYGEGSYDATVKDFRDKYDLLARANTPEEKTQKAKLANALKALGQEVGPVAPQTTLQQEGQKYGWRQGLLSEAIKADKARNEEYQQALVDGDLNDMRNARTRKLQAREDLLYKRMEDASPYEKQYLSRAIKLLKDAKEQQP
jgi:hypothetical protein